jgi:hypothetical protein
VSHNRLSGAEGFASAILLLTFDCWGLLRLNDFAAAQARSADADMLGRSAYLGMHGAQVDVPATFTDVVGVADGISELRPLAADITNSGHNCKDPSRLLPKTFILQELAHFC